VAGCGAAKARPIPYKDLTSELGPLEFTRIYRSEYESPAPLLKLLRQMNPGRDIHLPPIDWKRQDAFLVATGPRSSTGYVLRIAEVRDEGEKIVVVVREQTPSLGDPVTARVTYPFRLIALPRSDKPVKLKWPGRP
jgi:PrcB C-terminal